MTAEWERSETEEHSEEIRERERSETEEMRDRAQSLRKELAEAVHAPAEQDDHAAARKHSEDEDEA